MSGRPQETIWAENHSLFSMSTSLMAVIAFSFNVLAFLLAFFLVGKPQKEDELAREIPNGHPDLPPWMLLQVGLISPGNPDDLEKAQRVWVNRPKPGPHAPLRSGWAAIQCDRAKFCDVLAKLREVVK
jgi:hypothetical protein